MSNSSHSSPLRVRWWPAVLLLVVSAIRLSFFWLGSASSTQARVVPTLKILVLVSAGLLLWALLFSRLPVRVRLSLLLSVLVAGLIFLSMFRITGVTGDAVPVVEWRWHEAEFRDPASVTPAVAGGVDRYDYHQFYGPGRDSTLAGPRLARDWKAHPPVELWRREVGEAWSSFAILDGAAVTQEQRGDLETVVRYDLESGRQVWVHSDRVALVTTVGGRGPRATPTIVDRRVYSLGATGILNCIELETGRVVWSRDVVEENDVRLADYGLPSSPLVVGDLVVIQLAQAERSLLAYRRSNGKLVWRAGTDVGSYSSPILATLAGMRQILVVNKRSIAGHLPESGRLLWQEDWPEGGDKVTPPLLVEPNRVLVSAGYGAGSRLLQIRAQPGGLRSEEVWRSPRLKSKFASMALHQGTVYGLDDGVLTALDLATGQRRWKKGRYGHGQMILVGDVLLIQTEQGAVVLVEASPDEHRELARLDALDGKTWNPPALAGRLLLVRNNREAACYELPVL